MNHPVSRRVLAGTLVLPTLFGALVLWSMGDRAERTEQVPAAVVELDRPVTTGKGDAKQTIAAGRLLAGGLTSPTKESDASLGWELTDAEDARQGLEDGDYYAVVTIPRDFSRTLSGIAGDDPARAGITLRTNDASSAVIGEASRQVTATAVDRLGRTITSTYLQGVSDQTGRLKGRLGDAADGADRLADGTTQVRDGASKLDGGATELAAGLGELATGADRLADGTRTLSQGAGRLADGTGRLAGGTDRLADGLGLLGERTDPLPGQTRQLADGAGQVSDGVGPYTEIVKGWAQVCATNPAVSATNPRLCAGSIQAAGVGGRNADRLASGARQVATGADRLADGTPQLTRAIDRSAQGARELDRGARKLDAGAGELAGGSAKVATGADRLASGTREASGGAGALADGSARLADGTGRLTSGSSDLAGGLRRGAEQIPTPAADQAEVVADPVRATASSLNPAADGATLLVPAVLAVALWLGAFVTYLVRSALPAARLRAATSGSRIALAGWLPALGLGVAQAALLLGAVALLGAEIASPVALAAFLVLVAGVFAAVNQAFVAVSGPRRGWIASLAFAALQLVSIGGLAPIDTAPGPFQVLNQVLPVARAVDGAAHLVLGGRVGSLPGDVVVLLLWLGAALAVTTLAARRAQRLPLPDSSVVQRASAAR